MEYLIFNPLHLLSEIRRILTKQEFLVLTTPNVIRTGNILMLLRGQNIYDPYYTGATYARHTRVYTPQEVALLLDATGFSSVSITTEKIFSTPLTWKAAALNSVTQAICAWMDKRHPGPKELGFLRGDTIFALARREDRLIDKTLDPIVIGDRKNLIKQSETFPSQI